MFTRLTAGTALLLLIAVDVAAEDAILELDGFSNFTVHGNGVQGAVPSGALPVKLRRLSGDTWEFRVPMTSISPVAAHEGQLELQMLGDAVGLIASRGGRTDVTLDLRVQLSHPALKAGGESLLLEFTTAEVASSVRQGNGEILLGVPLDPTTGFLQMVAIARVPAGFPGGPTDDFRVVLSGRVRGLPAKLSPN